MEISYLPRQRSWVCLVLAGLAVVLGCSSPEHPEVVTSINVWSSVVDALSAPARIAAPIITNPSVDPHEYEPTASDASEVASADLVIANGAGYDPFLLRLASSGQRPRYAALVVSSVVGLPDSAHANPHIFYRLAWVKEAADRIALLLSRYHLVAPQRLRSNLASFDEGLRDLRAKEALIAASAPHLVVAATEPVPEYLIEDLGWRDVAPRGFELATQNGYEPSLSDMRSFEQLLTERRISLLFYNAQTATAATSRLVQLARQRGIPVVYVYETIPPRYHGSFVAWFGGMLKEIQEAVTSNASHGQ
jgi:zinc/manganese transport system substrate-binding protein